MLLYNVLSTDGFFTIQHGRYADEATANLHAEHLRAQGIDAYVAPYRVYA